MIKQYTLDTILVEVNNERNWINNTQRVVKASEAEDLELSYQTLVCATKQAIERLSQAELSVDSLLDAKLSVQTILNNGLNGLVLPQHKPKDFKAGSDVFIEYFQTKERE